MDMMEWAHRFEDIEYKVVEQHHGLIRPKFWKPRKRILVSTVWLGLDHAFGPGPPLIFETMIFIDGWTESYMDRYTTEAEAIIGHRRAVRLAEAFGTCYWTKAAA